MRQSQCKHHAPGAPSQACGRWPQALAAHCTHPERIQRRRLLLHAHAAPLKDGLVPAAIMQAGQAQAPALQQKVVCARQPRGS